VQAVTIDPARPVGTADAVAARRAGLTAALVTLAGGALTLNHFLVGIFYDDGLYAGIAYALSHGLGYVHPHLPGHPAVVHFPPLYPLLLTPFFGTLSVQAAGFAARALNILLAALAAGLVAWHATRSELLGPGAPRGLAAAIVGASAIALPMLTGLCVLFSEPLFSVLLALAVIVADRPPARWSPRGGALLAGVAAALALLTRSIGVAAGGGIALYLLLVRRAGWHGALLAGAPVAVAALGWGLWVLRHRGGIDPAMGTNYGSYYATLTGAGLGFLWHGLNDVPRPLGDLTLRWLPGAAAYATFGVAGLAILLCGLFVMVRRSSIGFTLLGYLAVLIVWPFPADRFIWAILPWLTLTWAAGALRVWDGPMLRPLRVPLAVVTAAVVIGYGQLEIRGLATRSWRATPFRISISATEMLPWLQTLPPNAVIAADFEPLFWLHTGRTSVPFYIYGYRGREVTAPTPAAQRAYLERQGVTYVTITGSSSLSAPQLKALVAAYPGWLTPIKEWRGGRVVFQVNPQRQREATTRRSAASGLERSSRSTSRAALE
jgi:hypothetical protein